MPDVIKLLAKPGKSTVLGGAEDSRVGERTVFAHDLFLDGRKVGFDGGVNTVVRVDAGVAFIQSVMTMWLRDGTITFQALFDDVFPPGPFYTAVTGGTGHYSHARGEMYVYPTSPEERCYRLYLVPEE